MKQKVLVTGAAGAIGYHLALFLLDKGFEVHGVDNFSRSERDIHYQNMALRPNFVDHTIDLTNKQDVDSLPDDFEYVFHLAAMNGTANFYDYPLSVMENSTLPTLNLIRKYAQNRHLQRFVYAGSSEAYASTVSTFGWEVPTGEDVPLSISDPMNPRWSYAISKLHGEIACVAAAKEYDLPFTIVRYHNAYGPRMGDKHVIPDFISRALNGKFELNGWEDTRTFIYVSDAVRATWALTESVEAGNQIINVGGELEISIKNLGHMILDLMGLDENIALFPSPQGSVARRVPKLDKLKSMTNFEPEMTLEEGLEKTLSFIRDPQSKF